jgi:hypothetical protein
MLVSSVGLSSALPRYATSPVNARFQCELEIGGLTLSVYKTSTNDYVRVVFEDEETRATLEVFSTEMIDGRYYHEFRLDGIFVYGVESENNLVAPLEEQSNDAVKVSKVPLGTKWWDGLRFSTPPSVKYYHPDKSYYGLKPWYGYTLVGNDLVHFMWDKVTSQALASLGPVVISAAIGALIGSYGGIPGAVFGAAVGALLGLFLGWGSAYYWLDEDDNLWAWNSILFSNWLCANSVTIIALYLISAALAINYMLPVFLQWGYLQVGAIHYVDNIGKGIVGIG